MLQRLFRKENLYSKGSTGISIMICLIMLFFSFASLSAQIFEEDDDLDWQEQEFVRGERKSALRAVIMSSIFPGSGHFYANRRSVGTFIFPVIEIALWVGYFYYDGKGDEIEKDYMKYADKHYDRSVQSEVEQIVIGWAGTPGMGVSNIYSTDHFRLDPTNTQHYYEDIGKYDKYIFGWHDWHNKYNYEDRAYWKFEDGLWLGNYATDPETAETYDEPYSDLRQKYIGMRRDAQENYDKRDLISFGFAFNRIISSLDAVRVSTVYNRELRYASNVNLRFQPVLVNNRFTPKMNLSVSF